MGPEYPGKGKALGGLGAAQAGPAQVPLDKTPAVKLLGGLRQGKQGDGGRMFTGPLHHPPDKGPADPGPGPVMDEYPGRPVGPEKGQGMMYRYPPAGAAGDKKQPGPSGQGIVRRGTGGRAEGGKQFPGQGRPGFGLPVRGNGDNDETNFTYFREGGNGGPQHGKGRSPAVPIGRSQGQILFLNRPRPFGQVHPGGRTGSRYYRRKGGHANTYNAARRGITGTPGG
jgi:hypothetical protein